MGNKGKIFIGYWFNLIKIPKAISINPKAPNTSFD
jgi:hypothetical protein